MLTKLQGTADCNYQTAKTERKKLYFYPEGYFINSSSLSLTRPLFPGNVSTEPTFPSQIAVANSSFFVLGSKRNESLSCSYRVQSRICTHGTNSIWTNREKIIHVRCALSIGCTVGASFEPFGSFSIPTCVQEHAMVRANLKPRVSFVGPRQCLPHVEKDRWTFLNKFRICYHI